VTELTERAYRVDVRSTRRVTINKIRFADGLLCLEETCGTLFSIREATTCPACGGRQWAPVAKWLEARR